MLSQRERVQAFADDVQVVGSFSDLRTIMEEVTRDFGADYYLMIHHTGFSKSTHGLIYMGNYPEELVAISCQNGSLEVDPIMEACEKKLTGFFWNEVGSVIRLTERHLERIEQVAQCGLGDGFVIPTHVPGEHLGSCHFAVKLGKTMPRENSAALQTIATFGFQAARRLTMERDGPLIRRVPLTPRQRQCLVLSARGKSDAAIARLLGLGLEVVRSCMEEAKRSYGVATRAELIGCALYSSEITYFDFVDAPGWNGPLKARN
jgi:LuxR family quorum-sensing system transcriptional regulator CciR